MKRACLLHDGGIALIGENVVSLHTRRRGKRCGNTAAMFKQNVIFQHELMGMADNMDISA